MNRFLLILGLVLIFLGYYLGSKYQPMIVSYIENLANRHPYVASPSANTASQDGYSSSVTDASVTISGRYTIPSNNKIWYNFTFPKAGGDFSGAFSGSCTGQIKGHISSPDPDNEATFNGNLEGTCTPLVGFQFRTNLKATIEEGLVEYKNNKLHFVAVFSEPISERTYLEFYFTP